MKDTVSAVEPAKYTSEPGVGVGGGRRFSRGFSSRSVYPLCPTTGFFQCKLLERAERSFFDAP